jgi:hypothetical protein
MIRRRHFTPALRRRLRELDDKPGLPDQIIDRQSGVAQSRMAIIDRQPAEWRTLLNDYPHSVVAEAAEVYGSPEKARRALEQRLGKAI